MPADEQNIYLMDEKEEMNVHEKFDSDLDRTLYQEYWVELREFK